MIQHKPRRRLRDTPRDVLERTAAAPTTRHGADPDRSRRATSTRRGINENDNLARLASWVYGAGYPGGDGGAGGGGGVVGGGGGRGELLSHSSGSEHLFSRSNAEK